MASYFVLHMNMCRKDCTWMKEYFLLDGGMVSSICEYEDKFIYRAGAAAVGIPVGAVPCSAADYEAALARCVEAERKKRAEAKALADARKLLRKGMAVHAHACEEAGAAEPVAQPIVAAPHFLDDFTVLDFETSDSCAIELAAVRVQGWQIVEQMQSLIQFRGKLNPYSAQLTGITEHELWNAPHEKIVLQQFKRLAGDSLLVAHNAAFDLRHLEAARTRQGATTPLANKSLCTVVVAKSRYPAPHKLGELCGRFGIAVVGAHRALNDVLMTHQLLQSMHAQEPIAAAFIGATSAAKAKKAALKPSLFAA